MANVDPTSNNGVEEKKWIISRIDLIHESISDEIATIEHRFDETGKNELSRLRGWRNDISYGLGIVLTLLIAIKQFYTTLDLLPWMLVVGAGIGVSLIVFNSLIGSTERYFLNLTKQCQIAKGSVDWSKSFFTIYTRDLDAVNIGYLKLYSDFSKYISGLSMIPILFGLVGGDKIWFKRRIKDEFVIFIEAIRGNIESGKSGYLQMKYAKFERPPTLMSYFDNLIKEYDLFQKITDIQISSLLDRGKIS